MAEIKYSGLESVQRIADYVNRKLTVVASMPSSPFVAQCVLYIGPTTENYVQGGIYLYDGIDWILISQADVDLDDYETSWTGTQDEWNALSSDEQAKYEIVNFTDDFVPTGDAGVVAGYYYNGKFYEESTHTTEITGLEGFIYIDLTEQKLYLYDGTEFVVNSGEGGGVIEGYYYNGKFYEDSSHTTEITGRAETFYVDLDTNTVYRYDTTESEFVSISGGLTAGFGIKIDNDEISTTDFVGTQAEWDALSSTEKAAYDFIHITDDTSVVNEGAPGHAISDETSEKAQRTGLKFEGFAVTDDSTNDLTKIAEIPYTAGDGIEIDANKEVATDPDLLPFTFVGTTAEWNGLTPAEKANYKLVSLTDDVAGGDMVVEDAVTEDSKNPVTSGAVYDELYEIPYTQVGNTYAVYYSKIGNLVIVQAEVNLDGGTPVSSVVKVGSLPSNCRPYRESTVLDAIMGKGRMSIDANGDVYILPIAGQTSSYYFYCCIVYVAQHS